MDNLKENRVMRKEIDKAKLSKKDIMAIIIAQFEILIPIALVFCVGMWVIILFLMKVWLK